MTNAINWFVTSSADPEKTAMTIKGILVLVIPLIASLLGIDQTLADSFVGAIVAFISAGLTLLGAIMTVYGIGRKIYLMRWSHPNA